MRRTARRSVWTRYERSMTMNKIKSTALALLAALMAAVALTGCCCWRGCGERKACDGAKACCCETCRPARGADMSVGAHAGTSGVGVHAGIDRTK